MATTAMSVLRYLAMAAFAAIMALGFAFQCTMSARAETAQPEYSLTAIRLPDGNLKVSWKIAPGNYLYKDKIAVRAAGRLIVTELPAGETKDDPTFGPTEIYHRDTDFVVPAEGIAGAAQLQVTFQGCSERGICYPPQTAHVSLATLSVSYRGATPDASEDRTPGAWQQADSRSSDAPTGFGLTGSLAQTGIAFLGFGLLLAFTPCVLPMVPILAGMLSRSAGGLTAARGFILSTVYVLAMAAAYGLLGIAAAWSGQNLQVVLQAPAALVTMALVFTALALASFGAFALRLPALLTDRLSGAPGTRFGPILGAAALGFTSALIVGPCVTPPLAAALIYVGQTGDVVCGALALFALGLGMGLPLVAVGTFGARVLPRAGAWLLIANRAFGIVFLAIAIVLVGRVIPPAATLALWAALALGTGVFIGAFDTVAPTDGVTLRLRKASGVLAVIYGATLIVGATAGGDDPLRPLAFVARPAVLAEAAPTHATVRSVAELETALATARDQGRPVLVQFTAEWCTSCRTMERDVFTDPAVRERLQAVRLIRADVTKTGPASASLMRRYGVVGPPTLVFLDPRNGRETTRSTGEISATDLRHVLDRVAT